MANKEPGSSGCERAKKEKRKIKFQALLVPKTRHKPPPTSPDPRKPNPMWDHGPLPGLGDRSETGGLRTQTLDYITECTVPDHRLTDLISPVPGRQQDFMSCIRYLTVHRTHARALHDWSDAVMHCAVLYSLYCFLSGRSYRHHAR